MSVIALAAAIALIVVAIWTFLYVVQLKETNEAMQHDNDRQYREIKRLQERNMLQVRTIEELVSDNAQLRNPQ